MEKIYNDYLEKKGVNGKVLEFYGVDGYTVYNTTPPLWLNLCGVKARIIAGRVERLDEKAHSRIMFFKEINPFVYELIDKSPVITGEDPAITTVNGKIILSVVLVKALFPKTNQCIFETAFFAGSDIQALEFRPHWSLPGKDNRIVEIDNGIAVTTRPQGEIGGKGTIAYTELPCMEDLSADNVKDAKLFERLFNDGWGGANELHWLRKTNSVGVIGHGAFNSGIKKIYFACFIEIFRNKQKGKMSCTKPEIIATRHDFPPECAKAPEFSECIFTSGVTFGSRDFLLYAGLGDYCEGGYPLRHKRISKFYK